MMQAMSTQRAQSTVLPPAAMHRGTLRRVVVATADNALREALSRELRLMRWSVREAKGAAETFVHIEQELPSAVMVDAWLPDLEVGECVEELQAQYPGLELFSLDGSEGVASGRTSPLRGELMHALRQATRWVEGRADRGQEAAIAAASTEPETAGHRDGEAALYVRKAPFAPMHGGGREAKPAESRHANRLPSASQENAESKKLPEENPEPLPEFVGRDRRLLEVSRRVRLVAHRKTAVLIHGPSGTGKELVARALHRLSGRPQERFIPINCAAIPEALVEAELFGYSKGAFTGAAQNRIGLLEAADGGTVFLDEIGELPLGTQSKLLRFLESGEIQRIGESRPVQLNVRVVAATHRKLGTMAAEGSFRLDLLQRLSVFLIETPSLEGRAEDIDLLMDHCLEELGREEPGKRLSPAARAALQAHSWPGNVRELQHTLERAWILAGSNATIDEDCIELGQGLA